MFSAVPEANKFLSHYLAIACLNYCNLFFTGLPGPSQNAVTMTLETFTKPGERSIGQNREEFGKVLGT